MFSTFPALLDFAPLGAFVLRVAVAIFFLSFAYSNFILFSKIRREKGGDVAKGQALAFGILEALAGVLLFFGLLTQLAALFSVALAFFSYWYARKNSPLAPRETALYLILAVIGFALLFLGAGAFAIDTPL